MITDITHVTVQVEDADEAHAWYTDCFGFETRADETIGPGMRWLTVAPEGGTTALVLQEPDPEMFGEGRAAKLRASIGEAPMTVLAVDDCERTVATMADRGVDVVSDPEDVPWGVSAIVQDLYGNPYNLVEEG